MKYYLITLLSIIMLSCESENESEYEYSGKCVNVKVVQELCGQAILQILDPEYFDHGQTWVDGQGVTYENVFLTMLPCNFTNSATFDIQFTDSLTDNSCARCYALLHGPEKFSNISIKNCGMSDDSK